MKIVISTIIIISALLGLYLMLPFEASAQDFTCTIKAGRQDVYVIVTDMDRDGNPCVDAENCFREC